MAVAIALVGAGMPAVGSQGVSTPGASPASSPVATPPVEDVTCGVPDRLAAADAAGDRTAVVEGTPDAGTPSASPVPVASPLPALETSPADAADIERTIRALALCRGEGQSDDVVELTTPAYRGLITGAGTPLDEEEYRDLAELQPTVPIEIRIVTDVRIDEPGRASAEVVAVIANQLVRNRVSLLLVAPGEDEPLTDGGRAEPDARWVVDDEQPLEVDPPADAEAVEVTLEEYAITVDPDGVDGVDVVLEIENVGARAHEVLVLRLDDGATTGALITQPGPNLPEGISFVGQVSVGAGDEATLVLVELPPGDYALVDLFPSEQGPPNLTLGMEATLTVQD